MTPAPPGLESDAILARLLLLHPKIIDLSLERMERILTALGDPQQALAPVIHIAGTNGKGSTAAYIRAGLEAAGQRAHVYTSPHLAWFHERIRLAGALIEERALAALLEECERVNAGAPITFFEITTAAAFLAFARTPAEYCILEVGLGGRLDATNVVARPRLTAITPVSIDHQQYLGETLAEIAGEKAGILKRGVPCVVGPQPEPALRRIEAIAARVGAPLLLHGRDWTAREEQGRLLVETEDGLEDLPLPALPGAHQIENAGLGVMALKALGVAGAPLTEAMRRVEWPARMQRLRTGPLAAMLPPGAELWLDGGHNRAAGEAVGAHLRRMGADGKPLYLIAGMIHSKDPRGFFECFAHARRIYAISIPDESATLDAISVAEAAQAAGLEAIAAPSPMAALEAILHEADIKNTAAPRIVICGSLYLAGKILRDNG